MTSASGLFADPVAEQTLALLLGLLRGLPTFFRAQQKREFIRRPTRDLHHATVGIVGLGGNGMRIAEVLRPFHTRIIATDMFTDERPACVDELWPADQLDRLLAESDIVILCVPLNDQTQGMIAAPQLARMKRGAILINVARGPIVVEKDLVAALAVGSLGRRGARRDRGRAAAGGQPAVGLAERHHHAARRRPVAPPGRRYDESGLRKPAALFRRPAAHQPGR